MSQTDYLLQGSDVTLDENIAANDIAKNKDSITDAEKSKLSADELLRRGYIDFVIRVKECVEEGENIDIYQYLACKWKDKDASKHERWILTHEVIMCIFAQIIGIIVILKQVIEDGMDYKDSCNDSPIELKLLAFALSSVAGYVSVEVFMYEKGMYTGGIQDCNNNLRQTLSINSNPPEWISLFWLSVGIWVNRIVSIGAVGGSFMVIFFSENAFDMVLNSVALFFLMELDDMLMTQRKYDAMKGYLEEWPTDLKDKNGKIKKEYEDDTHKCYSLAQPSKDDTKSCCFLIVLMAEIANVCCFCCYVFFGVFFVIACIVVPVYIGVCY